jgi:putative endonuclease
VTGKVRVRGGRGPGLRRDDCEWVFEHKGKVVPGFTARYRVDTLVWFEAHDSVEAAIRREKQAMEAEWKFNLIERTTPPTGPISPDLMP